jgi:hypothetical protein
MNDSESKLRLIFAHVPKAAGNTVSSLLERNFGRGFYAYYGLWDKYIFTANDVEGMCKLYPQYKCLASHLFSLQLPWDSEDIDVRAITFVRDPVKRALSFYFFTLQQSRRFAGHQDPGPIEEFFERVFEERNDPRFFNGQMTFLSRYDHDSLPLETIEQLMVNNRLFAAPVERFDDACLLLERALQELKLDLSFYSTKNPSEWDQKIPDGLVERLTEENKQDIDLHRLIGRVFEMQLKKYFSSDIELENARVDFQRRCKQKRWREHRDNLSRRIRHRINRIFPG